MRDQIRPTVQDEFDVRIEVARARRTYCVSLTSLFPSQDYLQLSGPIMRLQPVMKNYFVPFVTHPADQVVFKVVWKVSAHKIPACKCCRWLPQFDANFCDPQKFVATPEFHGSSHVTLWIHLNLSNNERFGCKLEFLHFKMQSPLCQWMFVCCLTSCSQIIVLSYFIGLWS